MALLSWSSQSSREDRQGIYNDESTECCKWYTQSSKSGRCTRGERSHQRKKMGEGREHCRRRISVHEDASEADECGLFEHEDWGSRGVKRVGGGGSIGFTGQK